MSNEIAEVRDGYLKEIAGKLGLKFDFIERQQVEIIKSKIAETIKVSGKEKKLKLGATSGNRVLNPSISGSRFMTWKDYAARSQADEKPNV